MTAKLQVKLIATHGGHFGAVYSLCKLNEQTFLSSGGDGLLVQWQENKPGKVLAQAPHAVYSMSLNEKKDHILMGTMQGELLLISLSQKTIIKRLSSIGKGIFSIIFSRNMWHCFTGSGLWFIFNEELTLVQRIEVGTKAIRAATTNGTHWYLAGSEGTITKWDQNGTLLKRAEANKPTAMGLLLHESSIFSCGRDALIKVFNTDSLENVDNIPAHMGTIHSLALVQPEYLVSGSMDKSIRIWDIHTLSLLKVLDVTKLKIPFLSVNALLELQPGVFAAAGDDKIIKVLKVEKV